MSSTVLIHNDASNVPKTPQDGRLDYLQVFRALAASMVAISHMAKEIMHRPLFASSVVLPHMRSFTFGVDIFFVISGFIMVYTTRNAAGGLSDSQAFLKRRLIRIVPVYWLFTTLFLAVVTLDASRLHHPTTDMLQIVGSYLFLPVPRPGDGVMEPIIGVGWTLNYEMFFYLVFAALLLLPRSRLLTRLILAFVGLCIAGLAISPSLVCLWYWTRSNILEFLYGAIIAEVFLRSVKIPIWLCVLLGAVAITGWQLAFVHYSAGVEDQTIRGVVWGIPAGLLVASVSLCPQARRLLSASPRLAPVIAVGDCSYSLYLCHMFVVRAATALLPVAFFGRMYPVVFIICGLALSIGVAHLSYIWFERPIHTWGSGRASKARAITVS